LGNHLDAAFDAADRTEANAKISLNSRLLGVDLPAQLARLEAARAAFMD